MCVCVSMVFRVPRNVQDLRAFEKRRRTQGQGIATDSFGQAGPQ